MNVYEVPISPEAQTFGIQLAGTIRRMRLYWSTEGACWMLDLSEENGGAIVLGLPVVTGLDLLAQYRYLGLGGSLVVQSDDAQLAVPTYGNLGTIGHLYFVTE